MCFAIHSFPHQTGICGTPLLCSTQGMRNRQLLILPSEEEERAAFSLPNVWDGGLQELGREAKGDYQIHSFCSQGRGREVAEFALTHGYASSHLLAPRRRCWGKITYTQIALLFSCQLQTPLQRRTARRAPPYSGAWSLQESSGHWPEMFQHLRVLHPHPSGWPSLCWAPSSSLALSHLPVLSQ